MKSAYTFCTDRFAIEEVILKSEHKYYIEGFASTTDPDSVNDIITDEGQEDLLRQLTENTITLDAPDHDDWKDPKTGQRMNYPRDTIPIGKVIKAERVTGEKNGVKIKAELNSSHPRFSAIWESIKNGFLHAFSVGFYPVEVVKKSIDGITTSFINKLNLVNITPTGHPINPGATFVPVMKSALAQFEEKPLEEKTMPEDKPAEQTQEGLAVIKSEVAALKSLFEADLKKREEEKEALLKSQAETVAKLNTEIETSRKEIATLKAELEKPVLKGILNPPAPKAEEKEITSIIALCR